MLAVGVLLTVLIVFLFGHQLSAKTVRGARTRVECLGFKEFMTRVDGDRIKRMPPDTFEKFLPYAMAFGVEQHWAKAFQGLHHRAALLVRWLRLRNSGHDVDSAAIHRLP